MERQEFFICNVTFQSPLGLPCVYTTGAIAPTLAEALRIAETNTQQIMPIGSTVTSVSGGAMNREMLEQVAEKVLGWRRP